MPRLMTHLVANYPNPHYRWEFQRIDENRELANDASLLEDLHQICVDGFGMESEDWNEGNKFMLLHSILLGRLWNSSGKLCGIAYYSVPEKQLDGDYFLWEDGICLTKEVQGKQYSLAAIKEAVKMFPMRKFAWLGCRTQIPKMFLRYKKFGNNFPFDEDYETAFGQHLMKFLRENIADIKELDLENKLNKTNGLCVQTFSQGKVGNYEIGIDGTAEFEKKLEQWGFQRERGDTLVVVVRLDNSLNNYKWQFQRLDNNREIANNASLLEDLHQVCVDGFGIESAEWNKDNKDMLLQSTLLGKLWDSSGKLCGIVYYSVPEKQLDGDYFLWEDGICLRKEVQGKQYSLAAIKEATKIFPTRKFGWLGCRTQIPKMFLRYKKLGTFFPFDENYETGIGKRVMDFLRENIQEIREVYQSNKLNISNGVSIETYPQGKLGNYEIGIDGTAEFENRLEQWGFQRDRGDAVIIVARLREELSGSQV